MGGLFFGLCSRGWALELPMEAPWPPKKLSLGCPALPFLLPIKVIRHAC
jgi:hypothetical protein